MYLSKIAVHNFRNFSFLEVELSQGLNVIVGENNVGKTNFLDAIRVALGSASSADPLRLWKEDIHIYADGNACKDPIRIDLTFSGLSDDEQAEFLEILSYNAEKPESSTASIHFEWSWNEQTKRWYSRRWGGERSNSESPVPEDVLQSVPITLLEALRDALSALVPGRQSRLGRMLEASANEEDKGQIQEIIESANKQLQSNKLIIDAEEKICHALKGASGQFLGQKVNIRASEPEFDRIVRNLRLVLNLNEIAETSGKQITQELRHNGLGYNNLIYIATVLAELEVSSNASLPLLLVEEPEAHLHPQLQILLSDFLAKGGADDNSHRRVQTIITTHSPTIAAHVPIRTIRVFHREQRGDLRCIGLEKCGLTQREADQLRRMFDVTRATLLFARGIILVEGITEALLLPVLSRRLGMPLEDKAISVVPICGVDFVTISKLFGEHKLKIPVSIVTDGDPEIVVLEGDSNKDWRNEVPKKDGKGNFDISSRVKKLREILAQNEVVRIFNSKVTLEYDLASAGYHNADIMCDAWERCFNGGSGPRTFNRAILEECGDSLENRSLAVWRGICRGYATRSKSDFAQQLAEMLEEKDDLKNYKISEEEFIIPDYIKNSIIHVK